MLFCYALLLVLYSSKKVLGLVCFSLFQVWDIGGQPRFRSMWERYCRGVNAVV